MTEPRSNCRPVESLGFGGTAGRPPHVAQSPIATTMPALGAMSRTQSIIGRPANMSNRPVPLGPWMIDPSYTKMSTSFSPLAYDQKRSCATLPISMESVGWYTISRP